MKKRNIQFLPKRIKYNAIKKFDRGIIKIPTYIIDEIIKEKMVIDILHNGKLLKTYTYENIRNYIIRTENKQYSGKFRRKDITYKLSHVET